jgi:hypothetical protein
MPCCDRGCRCSRPEAVRRDRGKAKARLERPIGGDWPYLWIDAAYRNSPSRRPPGLVPSPSQLVLVPTAGARSWVCISTPPEAELNLDRGLRELAEASGRKARRRQPDLDKGAEAWPAAILDDASLSVPAYMTLPKEGKAKWHSTNPIEHLIGEIQRCDAARTGLRVGRSARPIPRTPTGSELIRWFAIEAVAKEPGRRWRAV